MPDENGWVGFTPGDNAHLTDAKRAVVHERVELAHRRRGPLLGIVEVRVYEHGCDPQVSFTADCVLGADSSPDDIALMVERARIELGDWR
jgi:hypothetical protein